MQTAEGFSLTWEDGIVDFLVDKVCTWLTVGIAPYFIRSRMRCMVKGTPLLVEKDDSPIVPRCEPGAAPR